MNAIITDPALLERLSRSDGPFELTDATGRVLGVVMPSGNSDLVEDARRLAQDPMFDEWVAAVEEYRRINNTVPDAE